MNTFLECVDVLAVHTVGEANDKGEGLRTDREQRRA